MYTTLVTYINSDEVKDMVEQEIRRKAKDDHTTAMLIEHKRETADRVVRDSVVRADSSDEDEDVFAHWVWSDVGTSDRSADEEKDGDSDPGRVLGVQVIEFLITMP